MTNRLLSDQLPADLPCPTRLSSKRLVLTRRVSPASTILVLTAPIMSPRLPLPRRVTSLLSTVHIETLSTHVDMSYPFESDSDPYRLLLSVSIPFNPSQCDYACRGESFPGQLRLYEPDWSRLNLYFSVLCRLVASDPWPFRSFPTGQDKSFPVC
jgi:hypothetical protein